MHDVMLMMMWYDDVTDQRSRVHSEASLTLEITEDTRTTNTRHRSVVLCSLYTKLLYSCVSVNKCKYKSKDSGS